MPTTTKRSCSKRRYGCVGYVKPEVIRHREADGRLTTITALICNRCGQAHGRATDA